MMRKGTIIFIGVLFVAGMSTNSSAMGSSGAKKEMAHRKGMHLNHSGSDDRVSLELMPQMKQHQLANMRSHVEAVRTIVGLISEENFEKASQVAYSKLGLTEEMKTMCDAFKNDAFKRLGLEFHRSGDILGDILKTRDTKESLRALRNTMNYCVQCHAAFRQ